MPWHTIEELAESMEAQARKDKALAVKCMEGLAQYASELRRKAEPGGRDRTPVLRELVGQLACYWVLEDDPDYMDEVGYLEAFDSRMAEADAGRPPWPFTPSQKNDTLYGLYRYAMDLIPNLGVDAQEDVLGARDLIREIEQFWDLGSPALDALCAEIEMAMQAQATREAEFEMTTSHSKNEPTMG